MAATGKEMKVKIGITGSREGFFEAQEQRFRVWCDNSTRILELLEIHHGDCVGCDVESAIMLREFYPKAKTILHPPDKDVLRAFDKADEIRPKKPYLTRNKDIVNECTFLIAFPKERQDQLRSGTWSTIRYARKRNVPVIIFYPDGTKQFEDVHEC